MYKIFIVCLLIGCMVIGAGCSSIGGSNQTGKQIILTPTPLPVITIKYFTTTNCPLCQKTDLLLANLSEKYPGRLKITQLGLTNADNRAIYATYVTHLKVKVVPFIVVNERNLLVNYTQIVGHLEPMLKGDEPV